ncbi:uncharacterized protein FOMMEDRAFT_160261 [Fomitiporia mediterranea MF3/22]|uniref:uncharacterized protein n=1 Tax=Fomitiporia mediterranea (strain MF3/22) TaxID=694068 RepID=UPI0004409C6A|nr:uncharacterized protein FOMMEDRAFT_160261 [Fomitiporia mediterranea MF3/22]EJC99817.1 hypothetical protein FOMMEDRAFT_160261 [Fomitiporia mediterranea MF3/22]
MTRDFDTTICALPDTFSYSVSDTTSESVFLPPVCGQLVVTTTKRPSEFSTQLTTLPNSPGSFSNLLYLPAGQLLEDVRMAEQATPALSGEPPVAEANGSDTPVSPSSRRADVHDAVSDDASQPPRLLENEAFFLSGMGRARHRSFDRRIDHYTCFAGG